MRDSALLHSLLGIRTEKDLLAHPKIRQVISRRCSASQSGRLGVNAPDEQSLRARHQIQLVADLVFRVFLLCYQNAATRFEQHGCYVLACVFELLSHSVPRTDRV